MLLSCEKQIPYPFNVFCFLELVIFLLVRNFKDTVSKKEEESKVELSMATIKEWYFLCMHLKFFLCHVMLSFINVCYLCVDIGACFNLYASISG